MPNRRGVLSLVAGGALSLAGCAGSGEATDREFGLTTTGAEGVADQAVAVEVMARGVGVVTYRVDALPPNWQVTQGNFDPQPTSIREMYPPELVWESPIGSVTGSLIVEIPSTARPGEYSLPVEARAAASDETAVSTAVITVEGQGDDTSTQQPTGSPSPQEPTGRPSPRRTG